VDASEVLRLFRAKHDVVRGERALTEYWFKHYHYAVDGRGFPLGYWVANDDTDHSWQIEGLPDFRGSTTFLVGQGEGEPACHCYRCPAMLTVDEVLIDSPRSGLYRPVCKECKEETP